MSDIDENYLQHNQRDSYPFNFPRLDDMFKVTRDIDGQVIEISKLIQEQTELKKPKYVDK